MIIRQRDVPGFSSRAADMAMEMYRNREAERAFDTEELFYNEDGTFETSAGDRSDLAFGHMVFGATLEQLARQLK